MYYYIRPHHQLNNKVPNLLINGNHPTLICNFLSMLTIYILFHFYYSFYTFYCITDNYFNLLINSHFRSGQLLI